MQAFDQLLDQVRAVFSELRGVAEELLADLGCTAAERSVLAELDKTGPHTVPQLARVRAKSRQAMQKAVDRVVDRRWAHMTVNPEHQRSALVAISPAGRDLVVEIRRREAELLTRSKLPVSQTELRRTARTLEQLAAYLASLDGRAAPRR